MKSASISELAKALALAQAEIKPAAKDKLNPHFKNQYADLASVWDACRSALTKNGISVVQAPGIDQTEAVYLDTILAHTSGEWICGRLPVRPVQNTPQGLGSALTYARRYGLASMVGVAPDDDDGEEASRSVQHIAKKAGNGFRMPTQDNSVVSTDPRTEWFNKAMAEVKLLGKPARLNWAEANKAHIEALSDEQRAELRAAMRGAHQVDGADAVGAA